MYHTSLLKKLFFVLLSIFTLYACDSDYNTIGDNLFGEVKTNLLLYTSSVIAHNQATGEVQSSGLTVNPFGIYNNPAFDKTTAGFVGQLVLASENPTIGTNATIDSVYLSVPYFNTLLSTATDGSHKYKLDSIYGDIKSKMKLSVFESGYYMRGLDPTLGFKEVQAFYTDEGTVFETSKIGSRLNNSSDTGQNDAFFFNSNEIVLTSKTNNQTVATRFVPAMRLKLDNTFFDNKILKAPSKLITNDVFKDYFRGLYFKVEAVSGGSDCMAMMNFKAGTITLYYTEDLVADGNTTRVQKTITLNLTGNSASLMNKTTPNTSYTTAIANPNTTAGDERLYLRGGQGSMAVISLFNTSGELASIRNSGWLINEASLIFTVDDSKMASSPEPNRIYIYNVTHNQPIADYYSDGTTTTDAKLGKTIFSGILNKDASTKRGKTYKVRITNQIRNLIKNADSTNVKLGLVVTENISDASFVKLKTANTFTKKIPKASVMNPLGTILYGSNPSVPEEKRVKLQIYYTKPN